MARDPRFDILFEPQKIGPVTAPNRFYQVPHCTGMGYRFPQMLAQLRRTKAEGGWGVVNTEYCSIHPTSDDMPLPHASLWDEGDVRNLARIADDIHAHGALAGVELWHGGLRVSNLHTREQAIGPASYPAFGEPWQCRAMDLDDIRAFRAWHAAAARRARQAGFDIVYVYAAHTYLLAQFLDPLVNQRRDAYGGSVENRWRLVNEVVADTREAVSGGAAVALRVEVVDEDGGGKDERTEMLRALAPLVDLYDVTVPDYSHEMGTSRFIREGSLAEAIGHVRQATGKPVVGVGRFTTPETMLAMVKGGIVDLIGAARPSIADPFLPQKIRDDRQDDIRECIGCNICYSSDARGVPIRCTQNPTMGEEWRKGWHPESVPPARRPARVLVVGAGPAGLEAAHILGKRGVEVVLAEAETGLGGRVRRESRLPGLSEWMRVADYRINQIAKLDTVTIHRASRMTAA
ncbi:MAG TPA: NAD(P)-binding protein, partial [Aestuariivirgaceae bacterium]|nr:NAD(P)-binding protein [Aestuariivirgaceae bacterium]